MFILQFTACFALAMRVADLWAIGDKEFEISRGFHTMWRSHFWQGKSSYKTLSSFPTNKNKNKKKQFFFIQSHWLQGKQYFWNTCTWNTLKYRIEQTNSNTKYTNIYTNRLVTLHSCAFLWSTITYEKH